jgi:RimJ/RimL family protein N-acetyltransferase
LTEKKGFGDFLRRASAALVRVRQVLFFYNDHSMVSQIGNVVELSKLELEQLISGRRHSWISEVGLPSWFDTGGRLFALEGQGEEYVSFGWAVYGEAFGVSEIGGVVQLASEALWIWSCFTPPEHRGNGYYPLLLAGIRSKLKYPPTVIYCLRQNLASRRGIEKAGFTLAFSIAEHRWFTLCRQTRRGLFANFRRG